ncbi:MAG: hypothetical protein AMS27_13860 [Bacteroides sp. SM23_62_1]|nr:MAG: hypothetical protein AMS27_13860 [Bacteroides sp. SM23_62_1]
MPDGYVNTPYEETFTVIPPSKAQTNYGLVDIVKIVVDSVGNLPPGIDYFANSDTFYVDTTYCVLLSGTPLVSGTYDLRIRVIPYIYTLITGVFRGDPVVDDTSLTITIHEQAGIEDFSGVDFTILDATPNPFRNTTRIGFYTRNQDIVELRIYNLLGQLIYNEINIYASGKNWFDYNGAGFNPGTYLYRISNSSKSITRKLIRLE